MENTKRPINIHRRYHAHVYFDQATLNLATELCTLAGLKFGLQIGRVHQRCVGPHTAWSCQILFTDKDFAAFIPWLDKQRQHLTVFVHGDTGDDLADHTTNAYWLGIEIPLNLSIFK